MITVKEKYEIRDEIDGEAIIKKIEWCGRVCYKSESKITDNSARACSGTDGRSVITLE